MVFAAAYLFTNLMIVDDAKGQSALNLILIDENSIAPNQVTLSNLDSFELQFKRDLPAGTIKKDVDEYLQRRNLRCFFATAEGLGKNTFYCRIENIGNRGGFTADLSIRIHLNSSLEVDDISFRVDYL